MTDRWKTRYTTSGRGPALVLIHGVGLDLTMWDAVLPTLAITAENDVGSTPEMAERIAVQTMHGTAHVVPGLRHMAVVESPEAVLTPVIAFLSG